MAVNLDVDGYTKTLNHHKYSKKHKKLLKTKRILKLKYKPSGGPEFYIYYSWHEGTIRPSSSTSR